MNDISAVDILTEPLNNCYFEHCKKSIVLVHKNFRNNTCHLFIDPANK